MLWPGDLLENRDAGDGEGLPNQEEGAGQAQGFYQCPGLPLREAPPSHLPDHPTHEEEETGDPMEESDLAEIAPEVNIAPPLDATPPEALID